MAIWALVLSLIFFFPVAPMVGLGLGIAVLVRSRNGVDRGRSLAIGAITTAIVVLLCWAALIALVLTVADQDVDRDSQGRALSSGSVSVDNLRVGDCVRDADDLVSGARTVYVVPCDQPHQMEAYYAFNLTGTRFPGSVDVRRSAESGCVAAFEDFAKMSYQDSELRVRYFRPSAQTWRQGDRAVLCFAGPPTGTVSHTVAGGADRI